MQRDDRKHCLAERGPLLDRITRASPKQRQRKREGNWQRLQPRAARRPHVSVETIRFRFHTAITDSQPSVRRHRLTSTLPLSLHAFSTSAPQTQQAEAQTILQHIYSALPFDLFKAVLESPSLSSEEGTSLSDQTRFGLAKKCILERKKLQAGKESQSNEEETVVLAFGGGGAGNVQVVRKPKQNRKLWKVNG